jgi:DNA-nicking Smr family endonuclease
MSENLDLHGVRHIDVQNTVKRFIEDHFEDYGHRGIIITGNSSTMRSLVARELCKYKLEYELEAGEIWVQF